MDGLADTSAVLQDIATSKIADFAGEADAADADVLARSYTNEQKRLALLTCLVHQARGRARDDLAQMLCKRQAASIKKAKAKLEEFHQRQRQLTEKLILAYGEVLRGLAPSGPAAAAEALAAHMVKLATEAMKDLDPSTPAEDAVVSQEAAVVALIKAVRAQAEGMGSVRQTVDDQGGFDAQLAEIEEITTYRGDNYELLVQQFFKPDRATMFALCGVLEFEATSQDRRLLDALDHALAHWPLKREYIPDCDVNGKPIDLSFASQNWRRAIRDRKHPGQLVRRHFEAMVFTYLVEELRTGDIAVAGAAEYGDSEQTAAEGNSLTLPVGRTARYIRVQLVGSDRPLSLAEVQVLS